MERLSRKLHSKHGASMLLGLLYLLVCLTVGAVVLTAAATSAGRTERSRREQQNYLAVASAVELVKEDMTGAKFTGSYLHIITTINTETLLYDPDVKPILENGIQKVEVHTSTSEQNIKNFTAAEGDFLSTVSGDLASLYYNTTPVSGTSAPGELKYGLSFAADRDFPAVNGTLTVVKDGSDIYTLLVYLEAADGTNGTTLRFAADVTSTFERSTSESGDTSSSTTTNTTTVTTTVTWNTPEIRKGAVS